MDAGAPACPLMVARGRPRNRHVDDAALHATVELIAADGYPSLGMDRVAERAGVSKAALYRRWPNKLALAVAAIRDFAPARIPVPDTGTLRGDMIAHLRSLVASRQADIATYQALVAALGADAELDGMCRDILVRPFTDDFRTIIDRGITRGELPVGTDAELYADIAPALIRYRRDNIGKCLDDAFIDRIVDQFFPPAAPTGRSSSLTGATGTSS